MLPTRDGSIRLFRFSGIEVFLHWTWFIIAVYGISVRGHAYSSVVWNALEYLGLFAIVLMHEFGHSLACRQVGGKADQIILWPLGGVAYVSPPPRPGATFWSIAAGPLVNVMLLPVFTVLMFISTNFPPDLATLVKTLWVINTVLLVFNMLPIYPLDGGQILRSLLWFIFGPARSLLIAATLGMLGVSLIFLYAFWQREVWMGLLGLFISFQCWNGFQRARLLLKLARVPRHSGWACPDCKEPALRGAIWPCDQCRQPIDPIESGGQCQNCSGYNGTVHCAFCGGAHPIERWQGNPR